MRVRMRIVTSVVMFYMTLHSVILWMQIRMQTGCKPVFSQYTSNLCLSTNRFTRENLNLRFILQEYFHTLCLDNCKLFASKVQIQNSTLILTQLYELIILKIWNFVRTIFSVLPKTRPNINKLSHDDCSYTDSGIQHPAVAMIKLKSIKPFVSSYATDQSCDILRSFLRNWVLS